jgi:hypothetical protein
MAAVSLYQFTIISPGSNGVCVRQVVLPLWNPLNRPEVSAMCRKVARIDVKRIKSGVGYSGVQIVDL